MCISLLLCTDYGLKEVRVLHLPRSLSAGQDLVQVTDSYRQETAQALRVVRSPCILQVSYLQRLPKQPPEIVIEEQARDALKHLKVALGLPICQESARLADLSRYDG